MSEILDEHMTKQVKRERICKQLRLYTLLFTGFMALIYILFKISHWPGSNTFLLIALISINLQTGLCFLASKNKNWRSGIRVIVTLAATVYILYIYSGA